MSTLEQHIAARSDENLMARVIAAAEVGGIADATYWAQANIGRIVAADIGDTTLADVHAYAVATYDPPPPPGADASKITDAQVIEAVQAVQ